MPSLDQIRANRENALLSTGPRSEAGKQTSSLNHTTHGLAGRRIVLKSENQQEYDELLVGFLSEYAPQTTGEEELVHEVAANSWRLRRANRIEADLFDQADDDFLKISPELDKVRRYRTSIERAWHKAIDQLRKLQKGRPSSCSQPQPPSNPGAALDKAMRDYLFAPIPRGNWVRIENLRNRRAGRRRVAGNGAVMLSAPALAEALLCDLRYATAGRTSKSHAA